MKTKKYFILVISFLLGVSLFYSSTNPIRIVSDTTTEKENDYAFTQKVADIESKTSSIPQLSQTFAWDDNGTVICNKGPANQQDQQICSDGAGGAIITWEDYRNGNLDIYMQWINSTGVTKWADNGTVICNEDTKDQINPQICSDGARGAIITWVDGRNGNWDIFAQRINSTGHTMWVDNGTVICNDKQKQGDIKICSDDAEGAIITWVDYRNDPIKGDIYAQRINSTGHTQWGNGSFWGGFEDRNGTVICNAIRDQYHQQICHDDANGAIITWEDYRNSNGDIYAQRINSTGHTQWGNGSFWGGFEDRNGTVICNAIKSQVKLQICSDDAKGAIITWKDRRNGNDDIYAQRINSTGHTQWGDGTIWGGFEDRNGTVICNEYPNLQVEPQICSDGAEGAIITWVDGRNGNWDIFAQRINSAGVTQWGNGSFWGGFEDRNGTVICNEYPNHQIDPQICSDETGSAIITWWDGRSGAGDIYAQKINSAGVTQWANNGTVVCNEDTNNQREPQICCDGARGAIITWVDERNGNDDIYAQKIKVVSGTPPPLPAADDDDDDDKDTGVIVVVVIIIILASVGGIVVVVIVLFKKGVSKPKIG